VRDLIQARSARLVHLPGYSPDFNPIEYAWSKLKALLRKARARANSPARSATDSLPLPPAIPTAGSHIAATAFHLSETRCSCNRLQWTGLRIPSTRRKGGPGPPEVPLDKVSSRVNRHREEKQFFFGLTLASRPLTDMSAWGGWLARGRGWLCFSGTL
jgi:hypothetical protein